MAKFSHPVPSSKHAHHINIEERHPRMLLVFLWNAYFSMDEQCGMYFCSWFCKWRIQAPFDLPLVNESPRTKHYKQLWHATCSSTFSYSHGLDKINNRVLKKLLLMPKRWNMIYMGSTNKWVFMIIMGFEICWLGNAKRNWDVIQTSCIEWFPYPYWEPNPMK